MKVINLHSQNHNCIHYNVVYQKLFFGIKWNGWGNFTKLSFCMDWWKGMKWVDTTICVQGFCVIVCSHILIILIKIISLMIDFNDTSLLDYSTISFPVQSISLNIWYHTLKFSNWIVAFSIIFIFILQYYIYFISILEIQLKIIIQCKFFF